MCIRDRFNGALAAALAGASGEAFEQHIRFAARYAAQSTLATGAAAAMPHLRASGL